MVQNNERPPRVEPRDLDPEPPYLGDDRGRVKSKFSLGGSGIQTIIISVIVCLVVVVGMSFMGGVVFVTKSDFTKNIGGVATSIDKLNTSWDGKQKEINTTLTNIPSSVKASVDTSIASASKATQDLLTKVTDQINKMESTTKTANDALAKANEGLTKANEGVAKANSVSDQLNKVNNDLSVKIEAAVKSDPILMQKITDLTTKVDGISGKIDALTASDKTQTDAITKLQATPTPTSTSSGGSGSNTLGTAVLTINNSESLAYTFKGVKYDDEDGNGKYTVGESIDQLKKTFTIRLYNNSAVPKPIDNYIAITVDFNKDLYKFVSDESLLITLEDDDVGEWEVYDVDDSAIIFEKDVVGTLSAYGTATYRASLKVNPDLWPVSYTTGTFDLKVTLSICFE